MDITDYLRFVAALLFVLALIGFATWMARKFGFGNRVSPLRHTDRRLQVVEIATIDSKHRAALIRRDSTEHLVLLGPANAVVLETGIDASDTQPGVPNGKTS